MSKTRNKLRIYESLINDGFCSTFTELAWRGQICRKTLYNYIREDAEFASVCRVSRQAAKLKTLACILKRGID